MLLFGFMFVLMFYSYWYLFIFMFEYSAMSIICWAIIFLRLFSDYILSSHLLNNPSFPVINFKNTRLFHILDLIAVFTAIIIKKLLVLAILLLCCEVYTRYKVVQNLSNHISLFVSACRRAFPSIKRYVIEVDRRDYYLILM